MLPDTHLLQDGYDIRTVQELPGHEDVNTTMIHTHVLNKSGQGVLSPPDGMHLTAKGNVTFEKLHEETDALE